MKKTIITASLIVISTLVVFAQNAKDEQEILKIHASLDEAFLKNDVAAFERVFADDYVYSSPYGKMFNRAENLEEMRKEIAKPTFKVLTATSDGIKVKVSGKMAFVTGNWTSTTVPPNAANAEPHKDSGRYTGVYEKRNGKWMLVAEHFSEAPHDRKLMEQQVLKAGQNYMEKMKAKDRSALEQILAEEYMYTNESGKTRNRAEDLEFMTAADAKIEIAEISDQKVRIIGNGAAVETGNYKVKGSSKGQAFDETGRFTTTWVWRGGRWQIVADHTSVIK